MEFTIGREPVLAKGTVSRSGATCLACGTTTRLADIRSVAGSDGLGRQLLCAVAEGDGARVFFGPTEVDSPEPDLDADLDLDIALPERALGFRVQAYGMQSHRDLYLRRQLIMLEAFAEAIAEVPGWVSSDGGDDAYSAAVTSILGLGLGKLAQSNSTQVRWKIDSRNGSATGVPGFGRHALPMVWDFAEANPFGGSVGDWLGQLDSILRGIAKLPAGSKAAVVGRADARSAATTAGGPALIVTDPPYFDQIGYADLSDYFYVWHRKALRKVHPDLYGTIVTPKTEELIATPYLSRWRQGSGSALLHRRLHRDVQVSQVDRQ